MQVEVYPSEIEDDNSVVAGDDVSNFLLNFPVL